MTKNHIKHFLKLRKEAPNWVLVAAAFLLGIAFQSGWSNVTRAGVVSNRFALETSLNEGLKKFHESHGTYPASLDGVEVEWLKDPERRKMLLRDFYYENRGESYVLWWPRKLLEK